MKIREIVAEIPQNWLLYIFLGHIFMGSRVRLIIITHNLADIPKSNAAKPN